MPTERESDGWDALLREALERSPVAPTACPDAERMAAWHDGVLSRADARAVELHVADCAHCRALVASLVKSDPPAPEPVRPLWRRWRLQWVAPLAATAAAVSIWVAVPSRETPRAPAPPSAAFATRETDEPRQAPGQARDAVSPQQEATGVPAVASPAAAAKAARRFEAPVEQKSSAGGDNATGMSARVDERSPTSTPSAQPEAPAALLRPESRPASSAPEQGAGGRAAAADSALEALKTTAKEVGARDRLVLADTIRPAIEIGSPDPAIRWRVIPGAVQVSRSGGAQWTAATLPDGVSAGAVTAGHAPDGQTCWLVGRGGLVLRSTDGVTFLRVPFQPSLDLAAIRAQNGQQAVVTAADGRQFETTDGGSSWTARQL